jgi:hypothetical protein
VVYLPRYRENIAIIIDFKCHVCAVIKTLWSCTPPLSNTSSQVADSLNKNFSTLGGAAVTGKNNAVPLSPHPGSKMYLCFVYFFLSSSSPFPSVLSCSPPCWPGRADHVSRSHLRGLACSVHLTSVIELLLTQVLRHAPGLIESLFPDYQHLARDYCLGFYLVSCMRIFNATSTKASTTGDIGQDWLWQDRQTEKGETEEIGRCRHLLFLLQKY